MFASIIVVGGIFLYYLLKEKVDTNPIPADAYFDWDEYWKDIENGMSHKQQLEKRKRYLYYKSPSNPNWNKYKR